MGGQPPGPLRCLSLHRLLHVGPSSARPGPVPPALGSLPQGSTPLGPRGGACDVCLRSCTSHPSGEHSGPRQGPCRRGVPSSPPPRFSVLQSCQEHAGIAVSAPKSNLAMSLGTTCWSPELHQAECRGGPLWKGSRGQGAVPEDLGPHEPRTSCPRSEDPAGRWCPEASGVHPSTVRVQPCHCLLSRAGVVATRVSVVQGGAST